MDITEGVVEIVITMIALLVGVASLTAMLFVCRSVVLRGRTRPEDVPEGCVNQDASAMPRRRAAGAQSPL